MALTQTRIMRMRRVLLLAKNVWKHTIIKMGPPRAANHTNLSMIMFER